MKAQLKRSRGSALGNCGSFVVCALLCASCGGGGGGGEKSVCADFAYQEDAQAAYRNGAKQLDGDNDGIACEALPRRPPTSPSQPSVGYPALEMFTGLGTAIRLNPAFGAYSVTYESFGVLSFASGPIQTTKVASALQISTADLTLRFATGGNGGVVLWMPAFGQQAASTGVGTNKDDAAPLSALVGNYKLLGQRCLPRTSSCRAVFATAKVEPSGMLKICFGSEYSDVCTDKVSGTLPLSTNDAPIGKWSEGLFLGSKARSTIAFTYQDPRVDDNGNPVTRDFFTLFGQRDELTVMSQLPFGAMLTFSEAGELIEDVPPLSAWAVVQNTPLNGFFQDGAGNTYLRSTSGQIVSWSAQRGLRHYSSP